MATYPKATSPETSETTVAANERADRWRVRCLEARAATVRVRALADEWERDDRESLNTFGQHLMGGAVLSCAEHLRAALDQAEVST